MVGFITSTVFACHFTTLFSYLLFPLTRFLRLFEDFYGEFYCLVYRFEPILGLCEKFFFKVGFMAGFLAGVRAFERASSTLGP